jgi:acetoacetate decarboxylase
MVKGIPFDSPLYEVEGEIEYRNCEGMTAFFTIEGDVSDILPEGVKPLSDPPQGGIWIAHYSFSTVGEYHEFLSVIQVEDPKGEIGYYIPYIYVTNDAALAAGRELAGAPKKLARIELKKEYDLVQGILERPSGKRLVTFTMKPNFRASYDFISTILPKPTPLLSVRHLPPINGKGGATQLVKWYASIDFHSSGNERTIYSGPASITYDSPSVIDPVHKIGIAEILVATYFQFDMKLGFTEILKEY